MKNLNKLSLLYLDPRAFFRSINMHKWQTNLMYGTTAYVAGMLTSYLWDWILTDKAAAPPWEVLKNIAVLPASAVAAVFLSAVLYYLILAAIGGKTHFAEVLSAISIATGGAGIVRAVPLSGAMLFNILYIILIFFGLREISGMNSKRTAAAVLFPYMLLGALVLTAGAIGAASIINSM